VCVCVKSGSSISTHTQCDVRGYILPFFCFVFVCCLNSQGNGVFEKGFKGDGAFQVGNSKVFLRKPEVDDVITLYPTRVTCMQIACKAGGMCSLLAATVCGS
jgi:hypothetical protein